MDRYKLNKQFDNMGIDKESILGLGKEKENNNQKPKTEEENQEIMLIKRKLDYLQNSIVSKFNERFEELEKKIDTKKNDSVDLNRELTLIKNDISELKQKLSSVKVVFGEEIVNVKPQTSAQTTNEENKPKNPGNIKVEDYFNFSNKKFD